MNLTAIAAVQLVVTGAAIAIVPQHTASIVRLGLVALAAAAAVVSANRLLTTFGVELDRASAIDRFAPPSVPALEPAGLTAARQSVMGTAVGRADTPPLSTDAWQRIVVAALVTLHSRGIDIDNPRTRDAARRLLSDDAWRTITTPVPHHLRSDVPTRPVAGGEVATTVHALLDELDRLGGSPSS